MVFKLVKMFCYLFLSIIALIFLACLWRLVNGKDAFISIRYLLDYFNFFNGIEEINNIQGSIEIKASLPLTKRQRQARKIRAIIDKNR